MNGLASLDDFCRRADIDNSGDTVFASHDTTVREKAALIHYYGGCRHKIGRPAGISEGSYKNFAG